MKCTIKAKCDKETFLKHTLRSIECKYKRGYTYGFYNYKSDAYLDNYRLHSAIVGITSYILRGWDIDGFITFRK